MAVSGSVAGEINFERDVQPILETSCVKCHWDKKRKGKLRLDLKTEAFGQVIGEAVIVPGTPASSELLRRIGLEKNDEEIMPPQEATRREWDPYPLTKAERKVLHDWVAQGADWPDGVVLRPRGRLPWKVTFDDHIQPILEQRCVECHGADKAEGGLRLDSFDAVKAGNRELAEPVLTPGQANASSLWTTTCLPPDDKRLMPPKEEKPLSHEQTGLLRRWIDEGAVWPEGRTLVAKTVPMVFDNGIDPQELYHKLGLRPGLATNLMARFTQDIRPTEVRFDMMPIPGGTFVPSTQGQGTTNAHPVVVRPFWMGRTEVTWNEFLLWRDSDEKDLRRNARIRPNAFDRLADAVTRPTPPYDPRHLYKPGRDGYPAICMTQLSARMYTMWLSAKTGRFYRLPTAAEFEFAARNNTDTKWFFGEDEKQLADYAWFEKNADYVWHPVGKKKASPWGLHDILGNVWEWTLDDFDPAPAPVGGGFPIDPLRLPDEEYNRTVCGGSWHDPATKIHAGARKASHPKWKWQDPLLPQSAWHHTDALWVGFRVVRPLHVPPPEELHKFWPSREEILAIPGRDAFSF